MRTPKVQDFDGQYNSTQNAFNSILNFGFQLWTRGIVKFWNSTIVLQPLIPVLQSPSIKEALERVEEESIKLVEFMNGKLTEFNRIFNEKTKAKEVEFVEYVKWLNFASSEIGVSILELMQMHSDQMDQMIRNGTQIQIDRISSTKFRDDAESAKRESSCDENNVELDWDAFDRDLEAMSDAVKSLGRPQIDPKFTLELKKQIKELQKENLDLVQKAMSAEQRLISVVERNEELEDVEELRKALKREQVSRLDAEQKLKDAKEEVKAAKFAYKVAKAVATRIADKDEDSIELIDRRDSAYHRKNVEDQMSHQTMTKNTHLPIENPMSHESVTEDVHLSVEKDMSASEVMEVTNPFVGMDRGDANPFLESVQENGVEDKSAIAEGATSHQVHMEVKNPFIVVPQGDTNPFVETSPRIVEGIYQSVEISHQDTNPFLESSTHNPNAFMYNLAACSVDDGIDSNPFLTPKPNDLKSEKTDWNPFGSHTENTMSSSSNNPFLF
eukprot:g371.t1